jgi:hypothetical protein
VEGNGGQIQGGQERGWGDEGEGEAGGRGLKDWSCGHKYALHGEGVGSERGFGEGAAVVQLGVGMGLSLERYLGLPMEEGGKGEGVWGEMEREHMCDETFQGTDSQKYSV